MWPLLLLNLVKLQAAPNGEFHPREETAKLWTQTVCEETPENSKNAEEIKSCCKQPKTRKGTWNIKLTLRPLIMFPGEESYTYPYSHRYLKDVFTVAQKSSNSIFKETKRKNRRRKKQTPKSATLKNIYELHRTNFERSHLISSAAAQQGPLTHVISRINRCDIFPVIIGPVSSYSLNRVIPFTSLFNILTISPGGMSSQLRNNADVIDEDRDIGHLVRVGVSAQKYGIALFHVTQKYNWTKNFVLNTLQGPGIDYRETNEVSDFLAQGIYDGMADQFSYTNLTFKHIRFYNSQAIDDEKHRLYCDPANCPQSEEQCMKKCCESFDYKKYLERIRSEGRIIIITADYGLEKCDYLGDFFEAAWQEGFWDEDGHSEFVFILIDFQELDIDRLQEKLPLESPIRTLGMSLEARKWSHIFQSMVILRPQRPSGPKFDKFAKELWEFTKKRKHKIESHARYFNDSHTIEKLEEFNAFESYFDPRRNLYLGYTYDSIKLYETVLKRFFDSSDSTIADVFLNTNGFMVAPRGLAAVKQYIRGKKFPSVMSESDFRIDEHGDRDIDFEFLSFNGGHFERSGIFIGEMSKYEIQRHIRFNTKDGLPPLDTPKCGFLGEKCKKLLTKTQLMLIVTGCVILVLLLTVAYITRLYIHEKQLSNEWWRIHWHDLEMENEINDYDRQLQNKSFKQMDFYGGDEISQRFGNFYAFSGSMTGLDSRYRLTDYLPSSKAQTLVCRFRDKNTAVKMLPYLQKVELSRQQQLEFKAIKDIYSEHLVHFIGVCIDSPNVCILSEHCKWGSLYDILECSDFRFDLVFQLSLIGDLVAGMSYLHQSEIGVHGYLKSKNCLVDIRFCLKIGDYGLPSLRNAKKYWDHPVDAQSLLWTAPEILRKLVGENDKKSQFYGTQKGDVYSFGIILHEILFRKGPFYLEDEEAQPRTLELSHILAQVAQVKSWPQPHDCEEIEPLRPSFIQEIDIDDELKNIITQCWEEDEEARPTFSQLSSLVKKYRSKKTGSASGNLVTDLVERLGQWSSNLEAIVEERTQGYLQEKEKTENLLNEILPRPVATKLINGEPVQPEAFGCVTIFFSDIVGFTALASASKPHEVCQMLNDLYTLFDAIIDGFDVYKVETIGDAYMLVSGLPTRNGDHHVEQICLCALALLQNVQGNFKIHHRPQEQLKLRIGIHSGPCVAGVVGKKMPRYCLFGDTVNTSNRMESSGLPLKIHLSPKSHDILENSFPSKFITELRGPVEMKGKGKVTTYWLLGTDSGPFDEPKWENKQDGEQFVDHPKFDSVISMTPIPHRAVTNLMRNRISKSGSPQVTRSPRLKDIVSHSFS